MIHKLKDGNLARLGALLVAAAVSVAACGSDEDAGGEPGDSRSTALNTATVADSGEETPNVAGTAADAALQGEPIVLGVLADQAGGMSTVAAQAIVGLNLAIDDINAAGGVGGRPLTTVTVGEDNDATKASAATRQVLDEGASSIIIALGSPSTMQAKAVVQEAGVPAMVPLNLSSAVSAPPFNDFIWQMPNPNDDIAATLAAFLTDAGLTRVAAVMDDSANVKASWDPISAILRESGVEIVETQKVQSAATDVTAQLTNVVSADPDVILVVTLQPQTTALVYNGLNQIAPDIPRVDQGSLGGSPDAWDLMDRGALKNVGFTYAVDPTNPRLIDLAEKLGVEPEEISSYTVQTYDAVRLLGLAMNEAGSDDPAAINDAIARIGGFSPSYGPGDGFTLSFSPEKHLAPDSACGVVIRVFDEDNRPGGLWPGFEPKCS